MAGTNVQPQAARHKQKPFHWSKGFIHLFPIPALAVYTLFIVYPIVAAFSYSLFEWQGLKKGAFIGIGNFVTLFTKEPFNTRFWDALGHNAYYFILEMVVQNGIAFALAYIIFSRIKGAELFKMAYFLPRLLSVIVVGFLWKLLLNPNFGAVNVVLKQIGLESWARPWLGEPATALTAIILANCWFGIGFAVLIFLAGLQSISQEVLEAARLDGVRGLRMIRTIVMPMMMQSIVIITVFTFVHAFEAFELIYAMQGSQGEPYHSTDTLAVFFYRTAFGGSSGDGVAIGLGSSLAVTLFFIIAVLSAAFMAVMKQRDME
ncbi:sugar ABC transporter permease [Paenibacillus doosanensis]|uniref:Lactose transport system permease protein LacF n=1 Tax=Paenibacillus konkukensis TaxID=2020716 RepID=A0ABY4RSZ9_9BACL|nr:MULTISPECIES: sugar ABC transporter permease [Paenibacillus]MCS7463736.1 sugar ABC transporter permease [Paenibacillus doosanensis]UQZ85233.1 Lactose transport system permease protein LacF [Paenibacillus konkukensis]